MAQRSIDVLIKAFDLNERREFEVKGNDDETIMTLYFKPITRADRKRATAYNTGDTMDLTTHMLCQKAELEDGTKAFSPGDAGRLQHELPENVLNALELFLFGVDDAPSLDDAKKA